jgi:DnaJ domain
MIYNVVARQERGLEDLDYYQTLRITPTATKTEIETAYQKLVKESEYDSSIDRIMVDTAYRILSNPKQRVQYDTITRKREESTAAYTATMKRKKGIAGWNERKLLVLLIIVFVFACGYYGIRFGHLLKSYEVGDTIYMTETHQKLGTIVKIESHNFGKFSTTGYLIQSPTGSDWYPGYELKLHCYKQ